MNGTASPMLVASTQGTVANVSAHTQGTLLNVLTSTLEASLNATPPTTLNDSFASGYDLESELRNTSALSSPEVSPGSQIYGVLPGICVGFAMLLFLGISFYHYHRRFRRKRNLATEYIRYALDPKRPRIAAPGCFTNMQELNDIEQFEEEQPDNNEVKQERNVIRELEKGDLKIDDIPISVILHEPIKASQSNYTIHNPVFQMDEKDVDKSTLTTVDAEIHGVSDNTKPKSDLPISSENQHEVELRLSHLCKNCVDKVLLSSSQHQMSQPEPTEKRQCGHLENEKRWEIYDDCDTMDAFHGRPQLRERRRTSMPTPINRFGLKDPETKSHSMKLCPYCFSVKWHSTRL